jgi:hypothetical protein
MYPFVSMKRIACLRGRLAIEADAAMTAALTRLWEIETEKIAIAIQKEIDSVTPNIPTAENFQYEQY